jgi:hypothetical protein
VTEVHALVKDIMTDDVGVVAIRDRFTYPPATEAS